MRRIVIAAFLAASLFVSQQVIAADQAQKAQAAESKAKVLERNAAAGGSKQRPSPSEIITKPETQAVDPTGNEPMDEAITCLSRAIYWETKGQDAASMEAVANVVMNRLRQKSFPNTICAVVKQGSERGVCQFSWWCDGRSDDAKDEKTYAIAKEIARKALNRQLTDRTGGALYFNNRKASASWSAQYIETVKIGKLFFYKPRGDAAK